MRPSVILQYAGGYFLLCLSFAAFLFIVASGISVELEPAELASFDSMWYGICMSCIDEIDDVLLSQRIAEMARQLAARSTQIALAMAEGLCRLRPPIYSGQPRI